MDEHIHVHNKGGSMGHRVSDFYPLIAMLALVLALSWLGVTFLSQAPMLAFMGYFFLVFGGLKVMRVKHFAMAFSKYDVLAKRSGLYAKAYPFLELGFAAVYLLNWYVVPASYVVAAVMLVGALGVYLKLRQREEIPCACMGTVFKVPMTWVTLGEDLLMAIMAIAIIVA